MPSQLPPELCPICKEKTQFQFIEDYSEDKKPSLSMIVWNVAFNFGCRLKTPVMNGMSLEKR